ncbi:MAG: HAD family hydrolase [Pseudomonadota bacterium]
MRATLTVCILIWPTLVFASDPLPSWRESEAKDRILEFISEAVDAGSDGFVPKPDRIAAFDNDGTLWTEQPVYAQVYFALDRAAEMAAADPDWGKTSALQAAADGDLESLAAGGEEALLEVVNATHSGMSVEEFDATVRDWFASARNPTTGMLFTEMIYQPMLELMDHLRANDFRVFIVTGGGIDFVRSFSEEVYDVPRERVVGSMTGLEFETVDGEPQVTKTSELAFLDDKSGKPIGIARGIGRKPVFVGGNSDGDLEMLQWSTAGQGPRLGLIIRHTDSIREFEYDRESPVGRLNDALDQADERGWIVVDMAEDWETVWPN